jgi:hypothetical protein
VSEGAFRVALLVLGGLNLALGGLQAIAPGTFFEEIGTYGARNDHYIGDVAAFTLAAGAGLVIAAQRRSWRVPVLALIALWYALHALNHLGDIGEARSDARGVTDTVLLALGTVAFALLARMAARQDEEPVTPTEERPW